jgi:hypothetical protein
MLVLPSSSGEFPAAIAGCFHRDQKGGSYLVIFQLTYGRSRSATR